MHFKLRDSRILLLASGSPRRAALLESVGLDFGCVPSLAEPEPEQGEEPEHYVLRAAQRKCPPADNDTDLILGADTVVTIDQRILGKPHDAMEAAEMLYLLNGRVHKVLTAFCLRWRESGIPRVCCKHVETDVQFAEWPREVLLGYANSPEPLDKAGAYAIQGSGAFLAERIQGSWSNVVGLPVSDLLLAMLHSNLLNIAFA